MNETAASRPGASLVPDTTDLFTAAHLILIAVLALLVIAGIIFGARLAQRRRQAQRELEQHNAEVEHQVPTLPPGPPPLAPEASVPAAAPISRAAPPMPQPERPVPDAAPAPADASAADGPVTQLKGLGPKVAQRLAELGITAVSQLAALTDDEAHALDAQLGPFTGRMGRDRWQEQARFLAAGDRAGFEAVFGRL